MIRKPGSEILPPASGVSRRALAAGAAGAALLGLPMRTRAADADAPYAGFPAQEAQRVRETVLYAHSDLPKLRQLVEASPALANATMDWGFGDWESAIGAAGHMGRRDIAELLLEHGARPDVFVHAMLGNLSAVRAVVDAHPGIQGALGPHGISLLAHARSGGDAARPVVEYLEKLGGAEGGPEPGDLGVAPEAVTGTYSWSETPTDSTSFQIAYRREAFFFDREGEFSRGLAPSGPGELRARAAPSVRLRFELEAGRAVSVSVYDHELLVHAARVR